MTGMRQNKKLGQVFLHDEATLDMIVAESGVTENDHVVEIGCGKGVLSVVLAETSRHLTIIEIDEKFHDFTQRKLHGHGDKISFILGDVIEIGLGGVDSERFKVVANLPYQISSPFMDLMIKEKSRIQDATVMVQKEFADRVLAGPGTKAYGALSVFSAFYFDSEYLFSVSRECFSPVPNVDSAVIRLVPLETPRFDVNVSLFFKVVKSAFWGRRKTLRNCLVQGPYLDLSTEKVDSLGFFEGREKIRGEALDLEGFVTLVRELEGSL